MLKALRQLPGHEKVAWLISTTCLNLGVAILYYAVASLPLGMAIPEGHTMTIWLAAGVAFIVLQVGGYRFLPGLYLGSSLSYGVWVAETSTLGACIGVGAFLAVGSTLQAIAGVEFTRRNPLSSSLRSILRFLWLVGPLSCLISAGIGTLTLGAFGKLSMAELPLEIALWWLSNSLGVIAVAALAPHLLAGKSEQNTFRLISILGPPLLILGATILVFVSVRASDEASVRMQFDRRASTMISAINRGIERSIGILESLKYYFLVIGDVDRHQFANLTHHWLSLSNEIKALEWIPKVLESERKALEEHTRIDFPNFCITEKDDSNTFIRKPRAVYFPVVFMEPFEGNEAAFGFDLGSNPVRRASLLKAAKQNKPVATRGVRLVQEQEREFGFLIFVPVYHNETASGFEGKIAEKHLKGLILGVFRVHDMVQESLKDINEHELMLRVMDLTDSKKPQEIYFRGEKGVIPSSALEIEQTTKLTASSYLVKSQKLELPDAHWQVEFLVTNKVLDHYHTLASPTILIVGIILTAILAMIFLQNTLKSLEIKDTVADRTKALVAANEVLENEAKEHKRMESVMLQAVEEAKECIQTNSFYLVNMSHEIRVPLNGIIEMNSLLMDSNINEDQHKYSQAIADSADALLNLANDVFDLSKIESGHLKLEYVDFNFSSALADIVNMLNSSALKKGLRLLIDISSDIPTILCGDLARLRQVLLNLVSNAIKFTLQGSVSISARLLQETSEATLLRVEVEDTGIGIPQDSLKQLFLSFSQVDTRKYGGTGLGLLICKQLVEMMHGQLGVESKLGVGSLFWFTINLQKPDPCQTDS